MHVKDFIEQLKNYPTDDNGRIIYIFPVDNGKPVSSLDDVEKIAFDVNKIIRKNA